MSIDRQKMDEMDKILNMPSISSMNVESPSLPQKPPKEPKTAKESALSVADKLPMTMSMGAGLLGSLAGAGWASIPLGSAGVAGGLGTGYMLRDQIYDALGEGDRISGAQRFNDAVNEPIKAGLIDLSTAGILVGTGVGLRTIKNKVAQKIIAPIIRSKPGVRLFLSQFTLPTKIANQLRLVDTADEILKHRPPNTLDGMSEWAAKVTGSDGVLTKATREVLGNSKTEVNVGSIQGVAQNIIDNSVDIDRATANKIMRQLSGKVRYGKEIGKMSPIDAYDFAKQLEAIGWQYRNSSTYLTKNVRNEQIGNVYISVAKEITDNLDQTVGQEAVELIKTPEFMSQIKKISPRLYDQVADAKSFSDLRSIQAPFVRLNRMVEQTQIARSSQFRNIGQELQGIGKMVPTIQNPLGPIGVALSSEPVNIWGSKIAHGVLPNVPGSQLVAPGSFQTIRGVMQAGRDELKEPVEDELPPVPPKYLIK